MQKALLTVMFAALGAVLVATEVEARRVGSARSVGVQRSLPHAAPAQPSARPVPPAAPARQSAATAQTPNVAPAPAASRWAPMIGGLALGGPLGSMFGGSALGGALALTVLAIAGVFLLRMLLRPRAVAGVPALRFAGLGDETVAAPPPSQAAGFDPAAQPGSVRGLPASFDLAGFVRAAKLNFVRLQLASDLGALEDLGAFTTPEMFDSLAREVRERGGRHQQTDIVNLNAELLELRTEGDRHWASVRFSGMEREAPGGVPSGFEEVWNLCKPADGSSGWLLAGIQPLH